MALAALRHKQTVAAHFKMEKRRQKHRDVLGCICLYDDRCQRNCRPDESKWRRRPVGKASKQLYLDPSTLNNHPADAACHLVEELEEATAAEIVGLEAWSDGTIWIWENNNQ